MSEYVVDEAKNLLPLDEFGALLPLYTYEISSGRFYLLGFSEDFQIGDTFRSCLVGNINSIYIERVPNFEIRLLNITSYGLRVSSPNFSVAILNEEEQDGIFVSDFEPDWSASITKGQYINKILNIDSPFSDVSGAVYSVSLTFTRTA